MPRPRRLKLLPKRPGPVRSMLSRCASPKTRRPLKRPSLVKLARLPQRHHALTLVPLSTHRPWRLLLLLRLQQPLLLPAHRLPRHQLLRLLHLRLPRSPDSRTAFFKSRPRKGSAFLM